ncbi:MAG: T9SS type A sorting domain-containing protein [Bacteroidetes bacterium]|nr:T9SS type A sorting domain-containing protein [Bacteroidota bacterium]
MIKTLLFFTTLITGLSVMAQHRADKWIFGQNTSLNFTNGSPVVMNTGTFTISEGCSSVCDNSGALMFYTDGVTVWDSTHTAMPNGTGLAGDISSTQSGLIVPFPLSDSKYYVFTVTADGGENGFRYSLVDMTLNNGLGDVTDKNIFIADSVTEKLATVRDAAGTGYWIVVHKWGSDTFLAYHLIVEGIGSPVISHSGIVYTTSAIQNTYGQMKFSSCGERIGVAAGYLNTVEVFDFNVATGVVSNPVTIPMTEHVYGIEFSKLTNMLYVSQYGDLATLLQYNISLSGTAAIIASEIQLSFTGSIYALQMGPDGKIYVVKSFNPYLGVINEPDNYSINCNYVENGVDLDPNFMGNSAALGLPGFMQSFLNTDILCETTGLPADEPVSEVSIYPNPSAEEFYLKFPSVSIPIEVNVYNYLGEKIEQISVTGNEVTVGKNFAPGMYFIRTLYGKSAQTIRVLKYQGF